MFNLNIWMMNAHDMRSFFGCWLTGLRTSVVAARLIMFTTFEKGPFLMIGAVIDLKNACVLAG